ncbi:MAG: hypothetical protein K5846_05830, partial [Bacteroidales bacterium]|nr:hypothetical protein [Bacteroidales bacterium]
MKKLLLFLCFIFVSLAGFAKNDFLPTPNQVFSGDTVIISNTSACSGTTKTYSLPPFVGFQTSCSYSCDGVHYYTTESYISIPISSTISDTTIICYIDSVNGQSLNPTMAISIAVNRAPTISIPTNLIKHVTCPDGYLYPYADGSFHVDLLDSVQDYEWIKAEVDTPFFFVRTFYDTATLTSLKAGTYHVIARGVTGCEYHDSVIIKQPDPWVDLGTGVDTVCHNETGCINLDLYGGTPPYDFTWFYYSDTGQVFMPDTTRYVCGLYGGGFLYFVYMYDSKGCKFFGDETEFVLCYLFEYVEDSISLSATNSRVCYGGVDTLHAQSIGYETGYMWHVGNLEDSVNYSTWTETDSVYIAEYLTPPMTVSTWVSVDFSDQHGCVTHDSVWVEVYNPDVSMTIQTPEIFADSTFVVYVSPPGGDLYIDDVLLVSSIPAVFTVSTDGISVGEHTLKYAGTFGGEIGLTCEDEVSLPIQVETNPFVPDWEYEISIYPNPATTTLNLSSTG